MLAVLIDIGFAQFHGFWGIVAFVFMMMSFVPFAISLAAAIVIALVFLAFCIVAGVQEHAKKKRSRLRPPT